MARSENAESSVADDGRAITVPDKTGDCWNCGQATHRMEVNYEAWLCSSACDAAKDTECEAAGGVWAGVERSEWAELLIDGSGGGSDV